MTWVFGQMMLQDSNFLIKSVLCQIRLKTVIVYRSVNVMVSQKLASSFIFNKFATIKNIGKLGKRLFESSPATSLELQEGRSVFREGPKFDKLSNCFKLSPAHFSKGCENFFRGTKPPRAHLVTGLF